MDDADSSDSDPDMPELVTVSARVSSYRWYLDDGSMSYLLDGVSYKVPMPMVLAIERLCDANVRQLNAEAIKSPLRVQWFNKFLKKRHQLHIEKIYYTDDKPDEPKVEILEDLQSAGLRKVCRGDGKTYTLANTLKWCLNERGASYRWALRFWERDFHLEALNLPTLRPPGA